MTSRPRVGADATPSRSVAVPYKTRQAPPVGSLMRWPAPPLRLAGNAALSHGLHHASSLTCSGAEEATDGAWAHATHMGSAPLGTS